MGGAHEDPRYHAQRGCPSNPGCRRRSSSSWTSLRLKSPTLVPPGCAGHLHARAETFTDESEGFTDAIEGRPRRTETSPRDADGRSRGLGGAVGAEARDALRRETSPRVARACPREGRSPSAREEGTSATRVDLRVEARGRRPVREGVRLVREGLPENGKVSGGTGRSPGEREGFQRSASACRCRRVWRVRRAVCTCTGACARARGACGRRSKQLREHTRLSARRQGAKRARQACTCARQACRAPDRRGEATDKPSGPTDKRGRGALDSPQEVPDSTKKAQATRSSSRGGAHT